MALFVASAFVGNAGAQGFKDITSEALKNPSFELSAEGVNYESTVVKNLTSLYGWEIPTPQEQSIANATSTEIGFTNNGKGGVNPSDGSFFFWCRKGWGNANGSLTTTTAELEAGTYYIEFDYKLADYTNNNNYNNLGSAMNIVVKSGETQLVATTLAKRGYAIANNGSNPGNDTYMIDAPWTKMGAMFELTANGTATITVNQNLKNSGRSDVCYDNFKLYRVYFDVEEDATEFPLEVTGYIANPSFEAGSPSDNYSYQGWTVAKTGGEIDVRTSGTNVFGDNLDGIRIFNAWDNSSTNDKSISQVIAGLPVGKYKLTAYIGGYKGTSMSLFAGENNVTVAMEEGTGGESNAQFAELSFTKKSLDDLTIGINSTVFYKADNFRLYYLGEDLSIYQNAYAEALNAAVAAKDNEEYVHIAGVEKNDLADAIQAYSSVAENKKAYLEASSALNDATDAFTAAKSSYDALVAAIANAEQAGINTTTAQGVLDAETTTATDAMAAAEILNAEVKVKDASADIPVETDFVVNGTFDNNTNGWTTTTGAPNKGTATNQTGDFTGKFWENWSGSNYQGKMYQTINNIPNGTYKLKIAAFVSVFDANMSAQYVYANSEKTYLMLGAPTYYEVFTYVNNNTIEIGFEQTGKVNNWSGIDNVTLTYYGSENIVSSLSSTVNLDAAKKGANDAVGLAANVTGTELTDVNAVLEKYTEAPTDIAAAIAEINAKASVLRKAIPSYDSWKAVKDADYNTELPYASSEKLEAFKTSLNAEPTSASEADAQSASITTAYRQYVESNALAEGVAGAENLTNLITNPNFEEGKQDGWVSSQTGGDLNIFNWESFTDGDGKADYYYFDYNNNGGNNQSISQKITLPAGKYIVTATLRGAAAFVGNFYMTANKAKTSVPAIGNTGGVFGRGWNDVTLEFTNEQAGDVEIKVYTENGKNGWWGATRFRLVKIADAATMSISDAQYSTFIAPFDIEIPDGVTASKITGVAENGSTLIEEPVEGTIPANTPVLLYSESALTQTFYGQSTATADTYTEGLLTGVYVNTEVPVGSYVLLNKNNQVGFYEVVDAIPTVKSNRCYLTVTGSTAPMFSLERGEGTTSIEEAELTNETVVIYDLAGRRVEKMEKGIYIVNGKKVIR